MPHIPNDHLPPEFRCPHCDGGFVRVAYHSRIDGDVYTIKEMRMRCGDCDGTGQRKAADVLRGIERGTNGSH